MEQPRTAVFLFRRTLKELRQSDYQEIMRQIAPYQNVSDELKDVTISYNSQESAFKFSNGSLIQLAYLDTVADRYRYQSAEIHLLLIDELTQFQYDDYEYLKTRVRSSDRRRLRVMAATNPGGVGHGWVKDYFIKVASPEAVHTEVDPETGDENTRVFIPAKLSDHPSEIFRENYAKVLNAISDEQLKRALRDGDWDTFQGQVFREWSNARHRIDAIPKEVLDVCEKYIGFDWGFRDPACAIWLAVAPENEYGVKAIYAYREVYMGQLTPQEWAQMIKSYIDEEPIEYMILPHDCYSHLGGNRTIASVFEEHDIPIVRADSLNHAAKMHRAALLHQLLADSPDGYPYLQVHTNCANLIRTLPDLPYSDTKPEEISDGSEDHAYDALTYGLMVITEGKSWVIDPILPMPRTQGYLVDKEGNAVDGQYNIKRAIEQAGKTERSWKYR